MLSKLACFADVNINRVVNTHLVAIVIKGICCRQTRTCSELFCEPIKNCTNDQNSSVISVIEFTTLQSLLAQVHRHT